MAIIIYVGYNVCEKAQFATRKKQQQQQQRRRPWTITVFHLYIRVEVEDSQPTN